MRENLLRDKWNLKLIFYIFNKSFNYRKRIFISAIIMCGVLHFFSLFAPFVLSWIPNEINKTQGNVNINVIIYISLYSFLFSIPFFSQSLPSRIFNKNINNSVNKKILFVLDSLLNWRSSINKNSIISILPIAILKFDSSIRSLFSLVLFYLLPNFVSSLVIFLYLLSKWPRIPTFFMMFFIFIYIFLYHKVGNISFEKARKRSQKYNILYNIISESTNFIPFINLSRSGFFFTKRINDSLQKYHISINEVDNLVVMKNLLSATFYFIFILLYFICIFEKNRSHLNLENQFIVDFSYFFQIQRIITVIIASIDGIRSHITDLEDFSSLLENLNKHDSSPLLTPPSVIETDSVVEFSDATIGFMDSNFFLKNINIKISKFELFNIVGSSGSGKSSLISCISGREKPLSGKVMLFGMNPQLIPDQFYQLHIGISSFPFRLVQGTLFDNVEWGRKVSPHKVYAALHAVGALNLLERLDNGLFTKINEVERTFSTGETQRICIARAICFQPSLLILDEATSGLDLNGEIDVIKGIKNFLPNITIIIVRHGRVINSENENVFDLDKIKK